MSGAVEICEVGNPGCAPNDTGRADDRLSAAPYGARILFGIDFPALPGWADVWRSALWALHLWPSLPCHCSLNLPQASHLLGMTKERATLQWIVVADQKALFITRVGHRPMTTFHSKVALSFVIPSEAEGSAVSADFSWKRNLDQPQICQLDRGAAEWRDLRFLFLVF
jgi:hypothetical protein